MGVKKRELNKNEAHEPCKLKNRDTISRLKRELNGAQMMSKAVDKENIRLREELAEARTLIAGYSAMENSCIFYRK